MQTRSSTKRVTRQSSRSRRPSKLQGLAQSEELPKSKRRKTLFVATRSSRKAAPAKAIPTSTAANLKPAPDPDLLTKEQREELKKLDKELKQRTADLDCLRASISNKEQDDEARRRKQTLDFLEEHFTCALCLEIIAHPVTLPHPHCGHTFCAICMLKHFFSRFHRACEKWHESVECPMCRSVLQYTPPSIPRSLVSFPFAINRVADKAIMSLVNQLEGSKGVKKTGRGKSKGKAKEGADDITASWACGGSARIDWQDRHNQGKVEITYLSENWSTMVAHGFTALKIRLRV